MYQGYLLKINGTIFPMKYIAAKTYRVIPNRPQDSNSYVDGNGFLNRAILPHRRSNIEFNTPPIRESKCGELRNYLNLGDKFTFEYWNPKKGVYESGNSYMADLDFPIDDTINNDILYESIKISIIEY